MAGLRLPFPTAASSSYPTTQHHLMSLPLSRVFLTRCPGPEPWSITGRMENTVWPGTSIKPCACVQMCCGCRSQSWWLGRWLNWESACAQA